VGHDGVRLWFAELVRGGSKHKLRVEQIQPNGADELLATGLVDLPGHSPVAEFYGIYEISDGLISRADRWISSSSQARNVAGFSAIAGCR
jgi:hypothetical protein